MKVLCINSGNYRQISRGETYGVVGENTDGFESYLIIANNGSQQRYHKRYFQLVDEEPILNVDEIDEVGVLEDEPVVVEAPAPPAIPKFSVRTSDINDVELLIDNQYAGKLACCGNVSGNCGTLSFDGLNFIAAVLSERDLYHRLEEALDLITDEICQVWGGSKALIFFSTNNEYQEVWDYMDKRCSGSTGVVENPNSNNDINVWWIDLVN